MYYTAAYYVDGVGVAGSSATHIMSVQYTSTGKSAWLGYMASRFFGWAVSWFKKEGTKEDQVSSR